MTLQKPNQSFNPLPSLYVYGLTLNYVNPSSFLVRAGGARSQDNEYDILLNQDTTVYTTFVGLNGLDTGTIAASTWYYLYVIYDPTFNYPTGCLLSTSVNPILPYGYGNYRRIGWIRTDITAAIRQFWQQGQISVNDSSASRWYYWDTPIQLFANATNTAFDTVSLIIACPTLQDAPVNFSALLTGASSPLSFYIRPFGSTANIGSCMVNIQGSVPSSNTNPNYPLIQMIPGILPGSQPSIQFAVTSGASLTLWVNAYLDIL